MLSFQGIIVETPLSLDLESQALFVQLQEKFSLTDQQIEQFKRYLVLFYQASREFNLTAITSIKDIIEHHFIDSLALMNCYDLSSISHIADVGTGGGFPGIPLKIANPHISFTLIEVSAKKAEFLRRVVQELQLENIKVEELDWRTFLRKTEYPIDLFVSRASLHTDELVRMFSPSCPYKKARLVYWASRHWHITAHEQPFFWKECSYKVQNKERKLVFFALNSQ